MHFFCGKVHFLVKWTRLSRYCLEFSDECLEVDGVFLTKIFDHSGREKFGGRTDAVGFEKGAVGSQPSAKSLRTDSRRTRKFRFSIRLHMKLKCEN